MIEVRHLRKQYDGKVAIANLNLSIPAGEVYGLIGPNGAGKTTLIRILATLLEPTYGQVTIAGIDVCKRPLDVHPLIGYMSDFFSLYDDMLVWEYLDHFAGCYRIDRPRRKQLIDDVLELVSLEVRRDDKIKALSAACGSGCALPRPCCISRKCCCWTSRRRGSIRPGASSFARSSRSCTRWDARC